MKTVTVIMEQDVEIPESLAHANHHILWEYAVGVVERELFGSWDIWVVDEAGRQL